MGVQGLWTLLEPCGKRVNVEKLSNRKVAVDASIWLIQFMKAMRDEKGELLRNAHVTLVSGPKPGRRHPPCLGPPLIWPTVR